MTIRKNMLMEIEFVDARDEKKTIKQFTLKDCEEWVRTPCAQPWLDFFGWVDNTSLYKLFNYLPWCTVSRFTPAPSEKITAKLGLRAYQFFTSLFEYSEYKEIQKVMERGQVWFDDHRRMLIENGITNLERLEDLNESTRTFALELQEYRERNPLQYGFYKYCLVNLDDKTRRDVLDKLFPARKNERKEARERKRQERLEALEAKRKKREYEKNKKIARKEFIQATVGPWSFTTYLFDNADKIRGFEVMGWRDQQTHTATVHGSIDGNFINVFGRCITGQRFTYENRVEIGEEDFMERQLKAAFQGCFDNNYSMVTVYHKEFGELYINTKNVKY